MTNAIVEKHLADYQPPVFTVTSLNLCFELDPTATTVTSTLVVEKTSDHSQALHLDGEELTLLSISLDGVVLSTSDYQLDENGITLPEVSKQCELMIKTQINPEANSALTGLYISNGVFCTQCEAETFRKITYYFDRPDVLTTFEVKIIADEKRYPVLLSNGNLIEEGKLENNKHFAIWHDPIKKPCYLFALVAGDLASIEDEFITSSGKKVTLKIFSEHHAISQCDFAMTSLKKSMLWDEEHYGREYDLDIFNIVAVNDFNFGAMENKSLNIFNSKYILASPQTATDRNYGDIDTVVAHEYFHNWSGNRVTCRDWFQISLKEGFTVFREQSFDETIVSETVHRIRKVQELRNRQFSEDAGPLAHPVQPKSYIQIDNFYTMTVYYKGGEVIRMQQTLLGKEMFRKACDVYFDRFDGQAVTTDDFVDCMQSVSGIDLSQFRLWYSQAGTPELYVSDSYDVAAKTYTLTIRQHVPSTPDMKDKKPMLIPLRLALLNAQGDELALQLKDSDQLRGDVLLVNKDEQSFVFENIESAPTPSLLRHFSAPIKLHFDYSDEQLAFLMRSDSDGFNQWEACQRLAAKVILTGQSEEVFVQAFGELLTKGLSDKLLLSELLMLPSELYLAELMDVVDVDLIHDSRMRLKKLLAQRFESELRALYAANELEVAYQYDMSQVASRALMNIALSYLTSLESPEFIAKAKQQFDESLTSNMTNCLSALSVLSDIDCLERVEALSQFYDQWQDEPLVINMWFTIQAVASLDYVLASVVDITKQPFFDIKNPNNVYALINSFASNNLSKFHDVSGKGYAFLAQMVMRLDTINPMVAARLVQPLTQFAQYDEERKKMMCQQLKKISVVKDLSKNVYECISKSLLTIKG
jgi:aminopeptidase N